MAAKKKLILELKSVFFWCTLSIQRVKNEILNGNLNNIHPANFVYILMHRCRFSSNFHSDVSHEKTSSK